jgi:SAM-dependent methyltransferase
MRSSLPPPDVYEKEYIYWPWGKLIETVSTLVVDLAPQHGLVVDYMCGTGYLLSKVAEARPDLRLVGCSLDSDYIDYGLTRYSRIELFKADAVSYVAPAPVDIAICTAGIHHLPTGRLHSFLRNVVQALRAGGWFVIGEEVLSPFRDETSRRHATLELNSALLRHSIANGAPEDVLEAGIALLQADILLRGEFKLTDQGLRDLLEAHIKIASTQRLWPDDPTAQYGDRIFLCGPKSNGGSR